MMDSQGLIKNARSSGVGSATSGAPPALGAGEQPIFVDPEGRRARLVRFAGLVLAGAAAALALAVVVGALGFGRLPVLGPGTSGHGDGARERWTPAVRAGHRGVSASAKRGRPTPAANAGHRAGRTSGGRTSGGPTAPRPRGAVASTTSIRAAPATARPVAPVPRSAGRSRSSRSATTVGPSAHAPARGKPGRIPRASGAAGRRAHSHGASRSSTSPPGAAVRSLTPAATRSRGRR
jgi:hypothetical protein